MQIKNLTTTATSPVLLSYLEVEECPCMGSVEDCFRCNLSPGDEQRAGGRDAENYIPSPVDPEMPF